MPGIWNRHPRYSLLVFVVLAATLYFLVPVHYEHSVAPHFTLKDNDLPSRMARASRIYDKVLEDRKKLIKTFGPTPKDISMFPEDKYPWPPYTVWDFFPAAFNCPHEVERIGALGDGGKWVCGLSRLYDKPDCVVYSFGINYESSFEAEILHNTNHCQIWGYDFSVKSFGPEITSDISHRTHFKAYRLDGEDKFGPEDDPPQYTLETLLEKNGHKFIDILKVDIESSEFSTLTSMIKPYVARNETLPFGQLQIELHLWGKSFEEFHEWWEILEQAGLRPFWTEPNLVYLNYNRDPGYTNLAEYSLINVRGDNIFIRDPPITITPPAQD
ncbi:hypothetical protein AGABI2DRAFT_227143 [Agaricus bisporus var. bisporus H97]|uniref:hypothetical protein n=1 Tax=Agaricus bisporus var. bisporus (strain H97 / ATCC MYA-4626 / FGSC 10389) TaxID=936046 RepID=UPI00029F6721|nr:hypothetical protein AGABI2DRAFT_227143 [Agaricus bisporus var. bisporus H97]EKV43446.1 hypothetical protein AGABI2DRAFT_227143 [Agaricus bisporus var. bisporus H97]